MHVVARGRSCRQVPGGRRGILGLFSMPLAFGMGLIFIAGVIAVANVLVYAGGPMVPGLLSDMPTFYQYDEATGEQLRDGHGNPLQNEKTRLYGMLSGVAIVVFVLVIVGAVAVWLVEDTGVVRKGVAFEAVPRVVLYLVILLPLPFLWDVFAATIEGGSLYLRSDS